MDCFKYLPHAALRDEIGDDVWPELECCTTVAHLRSLVFGHSSLFDENALQQFVLPLHRYGLRLGRATEPQQTHAVFPLRRLNQAACHRSFLKNRFQSNPLRKTPLFTRSEDWKLSKVDWDHCPDRL